VSIPVHVQAVCYSIGRTHRAALCRRFTCRANRWARYEKCRTPTLGETSACTVFLSAKKRAACGTGRLLIHARRIHSVSDRL